jgi:lipopolysaccharide export system protein LptC
MDRYSRIIALLKVLLPLAALALLSTLFLISRGIDTTAEIPFAQHEIEERLRDQQVTKPFFSGTTAKGDEIQVTASVARPGGAGGPAVATDLHAVIKPSAGGGITLTSDRGEVRLEQDSADFVSNVRISTLEGLLIRTDLLRTTLARISATSPGPVEATGPFGSLEAGQMEISAKTEGGPLQLLFNNGVKLVYDPQKPER